MVFPGLLAIIKVSQFFDHLNNDSIYMLYQSLLEYERHKRLSGDLQLPVAMLPEASGVITEVNLHYCRSPY